MEKLPAQKQNQKSKDKDKERTVPIKSKSKVHSENDEPELKNEEKESVVVEEPVKRKRGRPSTLEKKLGPPKKVIMIKNKSLQAKKTKPEVLTEKRPRGRPRKIIESVNSDSSPVKALKTKVKSPKENGNISEGMKSTKSLSPLKTKSPVKESEIDEDITSTTEKIKDPDVVEDETVSSSCQDLVRSVKVQTKPISQKPAKSYINKVSF